MNVIRLVNLRCFGHKKKKKNLSWKCCTAIISIVISIIWIIFHFYFILNSLFSLLFKKGVCKAHRTLTVLSSKLYCCNQWYWGENWERKRISEHETKIREASWTEIKESTCAAEALDANITSTCSKKLHLGEKAQTIHKWYNSSVCWITDQNSFFK